MAKNNQMMAKQEKRIARKSNKIKLERDWY